MHLAISMREGIKLPPRKEPTTRRLSTKASLVALPTASPESSGSRRCGCPARATRFEMPPKQAIRPRNMLRPRWQAHELTPCPTRRLLGQPAGKVALKTKRPRWLLGKPKTPEALKKIVSPRYPHKFSGQPEQWASKREQNSHN